MSLPAGCDEGSVCRRFAGYGGVLVRQLRAVAAAPGWNLAGQPPGPEAVEPPEDEEGEAAEPDEAEPTP